MAGRKRRDPMQVTLACSKCTCQGQNPDLLMSRPRGLHHPQAAPFQVRLIPMSNDLQTKLYGACWKAGQPSCNTSIPLWTGSLSAHSSPSCCLSESILFVYSDSLSFTLFLCLSFCEIAHFPYGNICKSYLCSALTECPALCRVLQGPYFVSSSWPPCEVGTPTSPILQWGRCKISNSATTIHLTMLVLGF